MTAEQVTELSQEIQVEPETARRCQAQTYGAGETEVGVPRHVADEVNLGLVIPSVSTYG